MKTMKKRKMKPVLFTITFYMYHIHVYTFFLYNIINTMIFLKQQYKKIIIFKMCENFLIEIKKKKKFKKIVQ